MSMVAERDMEHIGASKGAEKQENEKRLKEFVAEPIEKDCF